MKAMHHLCTPALSIVAYQLPILAYLNDSRSAVIFRHAAGVYHEGETLPFSRVLDVLVVVEVLEFSPPVPLSLRSASEGTLGPCADREGAFARLSPLTFLAERASRRHTRGAECVA